MDNENWVTGNIVMKIGGQPVTMEMTVPVTPVKPQRMLPVFQKMTNAIVELSENAVREAGEEISCKMGCGACCRQAVPISVTEVYYLAALVEEMPEPRQTIVRQRFKAANDHFTALGWYDRVAKLAELARPEDPDHIPNELMDEAMIYFREGVACPFLEDESCSIHQDRPLVCREYLVTSPAENCSEPSMEKIDRIPLLLKPSQAMRYVGLTADFAHWGMLPLIRALEFAESFPEPFGEKPGERWAAEFFQQLTKSDVPKSGSAGKQTRRKKPRSNKSKNL